MAAHVRNPKFNVDLGDLFPPRPGTPSEAGWGRFVDLMREGGVGILPTDTVYGLHSRWDHSGARYRILRLKGRPAGSSLLCLINSMEMLEWVASPPQTPLFQKLKGYWPGALTMILPAGPAAPPAVQTNGTVAVRWPDDPFLNRLVEDIGVPLLSSSANPSGREPATTIQEISENWKSQVDAIIDGGPRARPPSTLIRVPTVGRIDILRQGDIKIEFDG
ncbi:MAG: threonylcarbamoyl-AMP synthase [Candidatus Eisenbacteria bacterium]|uniref:L-threonylcarbamoyladenylate synthase n=1 Tax=Eiseniibacteriota bacterium TaxID=2212470 RepID=A0A948W5L8_UNCEI|nr:threonylcarbamoyl-AMP synthase [Candidatus Eisenbacteria bacterium]MBU2690549.1 threonylcarbamoyl-AMP synthase [Candidatus Eisenbacteria bacterium]